MTFSRWVPGPNGGRPNVNRILFKFSIKRFTFALFWSNDGIWTLTNGTTRLYSLCSLYALSQEAHGQMLDSIEFSVWKLRLALVWLRKNVV